VRVSTRCQCWWCHSCDTALALDSKQFNELPSCLCCTRYVTGSTWDIVVASIVSNQTSIIDLNILLMLLKNCHLMWFLYYHKKISIECLWPVRVWRVQRRSFLKLRDQIWKELCSVYVGYYLYSFHLLLWWSRSLEDIFNALLMFVYTIVREIIHRSEEWGMSWED